jgi:hypothetical protein
MRNVSARQLLKKGFIGAELVCASGKAQAGIDAYPPSSDSGVTGCVWAVNNCLTGFRGPSLYSMLPGIFSIHASRPLGLRFASREKIFGIHQ